MIIIGMAAGASGAFVGTPAEVALIRNKLIQIIIYICKIILYLSIQLKHLILSSVSLCKNVLKMFSAQSSQKDGRNFFHSLWIRNDQCLIIVHQAQCIVYETIIFILLLILIDENYSLNHILKAFPIQSSFFIYFYAFWQT